MFSINSKSYHVFKDSGKYFLFDIYKMIFCEINSSIYNALTSSELSLLGDEDLMLLKSLSDNNVFFNSPIPHQHENTPADKAYFSLAPVHGCNLKCRYCFASSGNNYTNQIRMHDDNTLRDISNFICFNWMPECNEFRLDYVSGGEPLINKKAFRNSVMTLKNQFKLNKRELFIWLCSNGTLMDESDLAFFESQNLLFGLSLDGNKEQNNQRLYHNDKETYDDVIENIKMILSSDFSNKSKELWGLSVITKHNSNLKEIIDHHYKLGFKTVQMKLVRLSQEDHKNVDFNKSEITNLKEHISHLFEYVLTEAVQDNLQPWLTFLNDNDHFGKLTRRIILKKPYDYRCHAARSKLSFTPDRKIYPCDSFIGMEEFCIGDLDNGLNHSKLSNFENQSIYERESCKDCWARFVCSGDCFHNSYLSTGNISDPDPFFCDIVQYTTMHSIVTLNDLLRKNPQSYNKLYKFLNIRDKVKK